MNKNSQAYIGQSKWKLDTPCLVIDKNKLLYNIDMMQKYCNEHNVNLRPHAKTHKCVQICQQQLRAGAIGISVAKISEAAVLASHGISGILVTSPVVTENKIKVLLECLENSNDICVVIDSLENAIDLNNAIKDKDAPLNIIIDIDPGIGRTGIKPKEALSLVRSVGELSHLRFQGIQCYAGNLQHITNYEERKRISLETMQAASELVDALRNENIPCDILTGSGTGTYNIDIYLKNITEIQPGSYTVMDVEYYAIEHDDQTASLFQNAMTLLTTVISNNRQEHVTVDAGWKALYVNEHKPKIISHADLYYDWGGFGDEHGKVTAVNNTLPKTGEVLELIVPHCDPTINLFDNFYVTENDIVVDIFPIQLRGKSQ